MHPENTFLNLKIFGFHKTTIYHLEWEEQFSSYSVYIYEIETSDKLMIFALVS